MLHLASDLPSALPWFQSASFIVAVLGIIASLAGAIIGRKTERNIRASRKLNAAPADYLAYNPTDFIGDLPGSETGSIQTVSRRLQEVESELSRQNYISKAARFSTWGLTLGQYIIGGLLASSFLQEQLPHQMTGFLGVLVLLSALIYQNFRPDKQMRLAEIKKVRLRSLYRTTEDDLQAITDKIPEAPTTDQIRRTLTSELSAIEGLEFEEERPKTVKIEGPEDKP